MRERDHKMPKSADPREGAGAAAMARRESAGGRHLRERGGEGGSSLRAGDTIDGPCFGLVLTTSGPVGHQS